MCIRCVYAQTRRKNVYMHKCVYSHLKSRYIHWFPCGIIIMYGPNRLRSPEAPMRVLRPHVQQAEPAKLERIQGGTEIAAQKAAEEVQQLTQYKCGYLSF